MIARRSCARSPLRSVHTLKSPAISVSIGCLATPMVGRVGLLSKPARPLFNRRQGSPVSIIHEVLSEAWAAITVAALGELSALALAGATGLVYVVVLR